MQRAHVELHVRHVGDTGLADSSICTMVYGVRGFRFAHIDGLITADPAVYERLPRTHSDETRTQGVDRLELIRSLQVAQTITVHHGALAYLLSINALRVPRAHMRRRRRRAAGGRAVVAPPKCGETERMSSRIRAAAVWRKRAIPLASGVGMGLLLVSQGVQWGWNPVGWDWLLVSGVTVFVLVYVFSRSFPRLVQETVRRLWDRGVIGAPSAGGHASPRSLATVYDDLERTARRYRSVGVPLTAVAMALLWVAAFGGLPWRNTALWLTVALAGVAGAVLARLVAYGRLGAVLTRNGLAPAPQPGHVDHAAGLQPVGALFLRQATVVAAIGIFAGVWWLVIGSYDRYAYWRGPYVGVIIIAVGCEILAFAAPLWSFHRLMAADRQRRLKEADRVSRDILELRDTLAAESTPADHDRLAAELDRLTKRWQDIETMPTWPVDAHVRRRFTWNNVAVLVPVALKAASAPRWWQDLGESLGRLLA